MEIIHNHEWQQIFDSLKNESSEESRKKLTDSLWRAKVRLEHIRSEKKKRSIKIIDSSEIKHYPTEMKKTSVKKCQSLTMIGKPCPFKAVSECGRFCKKHSL